MFFLYFLSCVFFVPEKSSIKKYLNHKAFNTLVYNTTQNTDYYKFILSNNLTLFIWLLNGIFLSCPRGKILFSRCYLLTMEDDFFRFIVDCDDDHKAFFHQLELTYINDLNELFHCLFYLIETVVDLIVKEAWRNQL